MSEKYQCYCGARYPIRRLVNEGIKNCPACGSIMPHKTIMRRYRKITERKFILNCLCGANYRITPPKGAFRFECPKCGRFLLSIRPRELNGEELPRFIEAKAESK